MKKLLAIASVATLFSIVACDQNREAAYDQRREDSVVTVRADQIRMHIIDSMNSVCQSYMTYMQDSLRMAHEAAASSSGTRPRTGSSTRPTTTQPTQPTQQPTGSPRPGATRGGGQ